MKISRERRQQPLSKEKPGLWTCMKFDTPLNLYFFLSIFTSALSTRFIESDHYYYQRETGYWLIFSFLGWHFSKLCTFVFLPSDLLSWILYCRTLFYRNNIFYHEATTVDIALDGIGGPKDSFSCVHFGRKYIILEKCRIWIPFAQQMAWGKGGKIGISLRLSLY